MLGLTFKLVDQLVFYGSYHTHPFNKRKQIATAWDLRFVQKPADAACLYLRLYCMPALLPAGPNWALQSKIVVQHVRAP